MSDYFFDYPVLEPTISEMIKNASGTVTERSWRLISDIFKLDEFPPQFWMGKYILDIGSGIKKDTPDNYFPGAVISAVDPNFHPDINELSSSSEWDMRIQQNSAHEKRIGLAQAIPYPDNQFDFILSSHAMPQHIFSVHKPMAYLDMLRVMKPEGEIRLAPCVDDDMSSDVRSVLSDNGFIFEFYDTGSGGPIYRLRCAENIVLSSDPETEKNAAWNTARQTLYPNGRWYENN